MDDKTVKAFTDKNLETYMEVFGLRHCRITVALTRLDNDVAGECTSDPKYETALIALDPSNIPDEEILEKTLKHELSHIVHSPFNLFWDAVQPRFPTSSEENSLREVFRWACELTVKNIERMHLGHKEHYEHVSNHGEVNNGKPEI